MAEVSFDVPREVAQLIGKCIQRVDQKRKADGYGALSGDARLSLEMDLTATHANGCPMDFERMLAADDFEFFHDVYGIRDHIDRSTGKLTQRFLPRFWLKERTL